MKRLLVIGELNVDLIMGGLPSLPVLGQELVGSNLQLVLGGSSAICACWMGGIGRTGGSSVDFWGKVGTDAFGDFLVNKLAQKGVNGTDVQRDPNIRTGATISLTYPHDRAMVTFLGAIADLGIEDINLNLLGSFDHLHSASIFLQHKLRPDLPKLFKAAQAAGLSTSLDSGWDPVDAWGQDVLDILKHVDFFFPNETEAQHLTGQENIEQAAEYLAQYAKAVIVKLGKQGSLAKSGAQTWRVPGFEVTPVDTTGAGDAFNAGFVYAQVAEQASIEEAMRFGNACGAIAVTTIGGTTDVPTAETVHAFMQK